MIVAFRFGPEFPDQSRPALPFRPPLLRKKAALLWKFGTLARRQSTTPAAHPAAVGRPRRSHRGRVTGGHTRPPGCARRPLAHPSASVTAAFQGPPQQIRTFRPNAALFRSNGVVSAPMRTREVIETNRYPFRPNAERDTRRELDNRRERPPDRLRRRPPGDGAPTRSSTSYARPVATRCARSTPPALGQC